jgi:hypothetical protein
LGRAQDLVIANSTVYTAPDATAQKNVTVLIRHGAIEDMMNNCRFDTLELLARDFELAAEAA